MEQVVAHGWNAMIGRRTFLEVCRRGSALGATNGRAATSGIMVDLNSPAAVRVRAADRVLELQACIQNEDIEVRIAALEEAAEFAKTPEGCLRAA